MAHSLGDASHVRVTVPSRQPADVRLVGGWSVTTETLQPPTNLTSAGCLLGTVTLTWEASPSEWATGYEVRWSTTNGGPYNLGPLTTTLLTQQVTGLSALTTYYFVVRATRGAWFSVNSNQHTASCLV